MVVDMAGDTEQNIRFEISSDTVLRAALRDAAAAMDLSACFFAEDRHLLLDGHTPFLA